MNVMAMESIAGQMYGNGKYCMADIVVDCRTGVATDCGAKLDEAMAAF